MNVTYCARCLDCTSLDGHTPPPIHRFTYYTERADWVGQHRVHTGHHIHQWIEA